MFNSFSYIFPLIFLTTAWAQSSSRQTRAIGESCSSKDPTSRCPRSASCFALTCSDSVCICNEGFWPSKDFSECLPAVSLGETCMPSQSTCMGRPPNSMTCRNSQCTCADGYAPTDDGERCGQYFAGFGMSVVKMSRLNDTCDGKTRKCAHGLECRPYARNSPISTCQCAAGFRPRSPLEDRVRFNTIEDCLPIGYTLGCPTTSTSTTTTTTTTTTTPPTTTEELTTPPKTTSKPLKTTKRPTTTPSTTTTTEIVTLPPTVITTTATSKRTPATTAITRSSANVLDDRMTTTASVSVASTTTTTEAPSTTSTPTTTTTSTTTQSTTMRTRRTTTNAIDTVTLYTISISREPLSLPLELIVPAATVAACCLLAGILGVACACVRRSSHFTGKKSGPGTMSAVVTSGASSEIIDGNSGNGRLHPGWSGAMLSPDRNMSPDLGGDLSSPGLGMDDGRTEDVLMSEPPNTSRAAAMFSNQFGASSPSGMTDASNANNNVVPALIPPLPARHYTQQTYIANAAASIGASRNSQSQAAPMPPPPPLPARPLYGTIQRPVQGSSNNNNNVHNGFYTTARNSQQQQRVFSTSPSTVAANRSLGQQSQQTLIISNQQLRAMRTTTNNNLAR